MKRVYWYLLVAVLCIVFLATCVGRAEAARCDGNNGKGKGNICEPAANPGTPSTGETDRQYIERVHGYTHGNSIAINHLDKRQEVTEAATAANREYIERVHSYAHGNSLGIQSLDKRTDALEAGKVDRSEFTADQARQDKATAAAVAQNERTAQIVSGHTGSIRELEGRATQADLGIAENRAANVRQDKTLATHGNRLDDHDARFAAHADVTAALNTRLGGAYERIDGHERRISNLERNMDRLDESAAIGLAVAGHQFDTKGGFQTAVSVSTVNSREALAIGMGGAISDRVFVNIGVATSGNTTGGVASSTFSW